MTGDGWEGSEQAGKRTLNRGEASQPYRTCSLEEEKQSGTGREEVALSAHPMTLTSPHLDVCPGGVGKEKGREGGGYGAVRV
jgi:hypothetical protein